MQNINDNGNINGNIGEDGEIIAPRVDRINAALNVARDAHKVALTARCHEIAKDLVDLAIDNPTEPWAYPILSQETRDGSLGSSAFAFAMGWSTSASPEAKAIARAAQAFGKVRPADLVNAIKVGAKQDAVAIGNDKGEDRAVKARARALQTTSTGETAEEAAINGLNKAYDREASKGLDHRATIGRAKALIRRGHATRDDFSFSFEL